MKTPIIKSREQGYYLFLMIAAFTSTLGLGIFYWFIGAVEVAKMSFSAFGIFLLLISLSFLSVPLVILFRASIGTALGAFFLQTMMTGGVSSPAISEFILIPLLAYFYKPIYDRYVFFGLSLSAIFLVWYLSKLNYAQLQVLEDYQAIHSVVVTIFVFSIVTVFSFLFRGAIASKNKLLGISMTELKAATQKLVQAEKMASLGLLSAGVAHEINNPLNFIKGGIDGLANEMQSVDLKTENSDQFIEYVREGVNRATVIVNSLSHFSRQSENMQEHCDIHLIIDNCLVMLQNRLKFKVEVFRNYQDVKVILIGNEGQLHQAFMNFFSNAEQSIENKGNIWIKTFLHTNGDFEVTIKDNGIGIKPEHIEKISEPFFTTKSSESGVGLGMTITNKIIRDHQGSIKVASSTENESGTTFTLSWPKEVVVTT